MNIKIHLKIFLFGIFLLSECIYGLGIGATESEIHIFAKNGKKVIYKKLCLVNPNKASREISVGIKRSNGNGYFLPLPNLDWVNVNPRAIAVEPSSQSEPIEISISIPDSAIYLNKRFIFDLIVQPGKTGAFVAGIIVPVYITTEPSHRIPQSCDSCGLIIYPNSINLASKLDSIYIVNWSSDTARLNIGWNRSGQKGWQDALLIMQRVMATYVPIQKDFIIEPNGKKKIFIKPLAFPGKGKLYFNSENGLQDFINIEWGTF